MKAKVGSFAKATATGNQAITGLGFQPSIVFLFWGQGTVGGTWVDGAGMGFGVGISGSSRSCYYTFPDAGTARRRQHRNAIYSTCHTAGTVLAEATLNSLDSDGFTLNWSTADATTYLVGYLALGGSDLTNVKDFEWQPATGGSTGNKSKTGIGFQPDAAIHFSAVPAAAAPTSVSDAAFMFAAYRTTTERWAGIGKKGSSAAATTFSNVRTLADFSETAGTDYFYADLVSMDSDGFTHNLTANAWNQYTLGAALKGGSYKVGSFTKATSTGNQAITGLGFAPVAVLLFTTHMTTIDSEDQTKCRFSIGAGDLFGNGRSVVNQLQDAVNNSACMTSTTSPITIADNDTKTTDGQATISFQSDGFTLNWGTNDAVADYIGYIAFGANAAPVFTSSPAASYAGGGTYCSPTAPTYSVSWNATDDNTIGANALTWELRTASGGGGSLLDSGTFTSGGGGLSTRSYTTIPVGISTLWVRISDGVNFTEQSVNVERRDVGPMLIQPQRATFAAMLSRSF